MQYPNLVIKPAQPNLPRASHPARCTPINTPKAPPLSTTNRPTVSQTSRQNASTIWETQRQNSNGVHQTARVQYILFSHDRQY